MKVIPERRHAHYIGYLRVYCVLSNIDMMVEDI